MTYNRGTVTELTTQNDIGIVSDCLSQCDNQGASCLSVILNNERGGRQSCSAVTSSAVADQTDPTSATGVSYFEKICLSKSIITVSFDGSTGPSDFRTFKIHKVS